MDGKSCEILIVANDVEPIRKLLERYFTMLCKANAFFSVCLIFIVSGGALQTTAGSEANKELVRRGTEEIWNQKNLEGAFISWGSPPTQIIRRISR